MGAGANRSKHTLLLSSSPGFKVILLVIHRHTWNLETIDIYSFEVFGLFALFDQDVSFTCSLCSVIFKKSKTLIKQECKEVSYKDMQALIIALLSLMGHSFYFPLCFCSLSAWWLTSAYSFCSLSACTWLEQGAGNITVSKMALTLMGLTVWQGLVVREKGGERDRESLKQTKEHTWKHCDINCRSWFVSGSWNQSKWLKTSIFNKKSNRKFQSKSHILIIS